MTLPYKILGVLIILLGVFLGGFYSGRGEKQVETVEKVVEKQGEVQVVYRDHIITVTKIVKPDGTVTEVTKTEDQDKKTDTKTDVVTDDKQVITTPQLSRYSLGLFGQIRDIQLSQLPRPQLGVSAGVRVVGDIWAKLGIVPADKSISLGIDIHF